MLCREESTEESITEFINRFRGKHHIPYVEDILEYVSSKEESKGSFYLYSALKGFFNNDGRLCYVISLEQDIPMEKALRKALKELESLEIVDLICVPDIVGVGNEKSQMQEMQRMVLDHCHRKGDRFAILDAPDLSTEENPIEAILEYREQLHGDSGALYFPWIKIQNDIDRSEGYYVPPCGHIAGIYARSDRENGFHKAPANEILEGVIDLQFPDKKLVELYSYCDPETGEPESGINLLRIFRGRGIRVWSARTLSNDTLWRYISVRRLFLTVTRWIRSNLADFVFQTNDYKLWVRIERELSVYFESLRLEGALQGSAPQEAFYVKCNAENNPPEYREEGKVVTEIGLAPTIPNEFIIVFLVHGATGVSLSLAPSDINPHPFSRQLLDQRLS
ncbi:MAG: phage tail sheath family protein [Oscillatoria sp. SIO1A7]|nr:phage tail sheath family protein [Oscillatoria sp. SIO1A7]